MMVVSEYVKKYYQMKWLIRFVCYKFQKLSNKKQTHHINVNILLKLDEKKVLSLCDTLKKI